MKITRLFIAITLFLLTQFANAASIEWEFTNSGQNWNPNQTITLKAKLTNTGSDPLILGDYSNGINGDGYAYSHDSIFSQYDVVPVLSSAIFPMTPTPLASGASIDFIFATFVPKATVNYYSNIASTFSEYLSLSSGEDVYSLNSFTANIIATPVPPSFVLMLSGLFIFLFRGRFLKFKAS